MNLKKILSELKRRNVIKTGVVYLVVTWMIIQVGSIILPIFKAPDSIMQSIVILAIIGFPFWLVFSWIYDITPEGIKKTSDNEEINDEVNLKIGKRLNFIITVSLSIAVILLVYNQIKNQEFVERGKTLGNVNLSGAIAVLPFSNLKPDPENDHLGFALANQIIGNLNYLQNIEVRSSSSIRKYSNKDVDFIKVADELDVEYAMIGNYIKENNRVRLSVELIEIVSNKLVWRSDDIEVDYQNIFELQDIVASKVVNGLNIQFSEHEINRIVKDVPNDPLAFEYYLRSLSYPLTSEGDELAINMLKKSITLDSLYAPSYAELGFRTQRMSHFEMLNPENFIKPEKFYLKALSLNPENLNALGYLAVNYTESYNTEKAVEILKKMLKINPNHARARFSLGYLYRYIGMLKESVIEMEKAIKIDPNNPDYRRIGVSYVCLNEFDKALSALRRGKETPYTQIWQAVTLYRMQKFNSALELLNKIIENQEEPYIIASSLAIKAAINKNNEEGLKAVKIIEDANIADAEGWYFYSTMYASLGDYIGAIRCLKEAVKRGYFNYPFMNTDPLLDPMREIPQFQRILEKAKTGHLYFKEKLFKP